MHEQSALGSKRINALPKYTDLRLARVTSIADFQKFARINVMFLDYSQPLPVWCFGHVDREPVEGDWVLVGFMDGRKDAPYLHSFLKNMSYGTNFVVLKRDKIKLQLPVFGIGTAGSPSAKDVAGNLLDNTKQAQRGYLEITPDHVYVSFPTSQDGSTAPATIEVTATGITINHPTGNIVHHGGSKGVARVGDPVTVNVGGTNYTGTITSGSVKTMVD